MRVLVGGVGYRFLRDGSVGPHLSDLLAERQGNGRPVELPPEVELEVEDLSYHPVGLSQNLQDRPAYDRIVLIGAVGRGDDPGTIRAYRWDGGLPSRDEIQERVAEAVTGVISLDNLLIVCGALGGFPDDVRVIEIEPADEGWGEGFSEVVEQRLDDVLEAVWTSIAP